MRYFAPIDQKGARLLFTPNLDEPVHNGNCLTDNIYRFKLYSAFIKNEERVLALVEDPAPVGLEALSNSKTASLGYPLAAA